MKKLLFTLMLLLTAVFTIAAQQTPPPEIVFTEDETGCEVRAVGQGEVHLYNSKGIEVENPYRISSPYGYDGENYSSQDGLLYRYLLFSAKAKAGGQSESEVVEKKIYITPTPEVYSETNYSTSHYIEELGYDNPYDYEISTYCPIGEGWLLMNGEVVDEPYTVMLSVLEDVCEFTAKAKKEGMLSSYSDTIRFAPLRKEQLVSITSDDDYYYVTATGSGNITLEVYNDYYDSYFDFGEGSVTLAIPRQGWMEWTYVAKNYKEPGEDLLSYDLGKFMVIFKELTATGNGPSIFGWPSNYQYKILAVPHYSFDIDTQTDHVQLQYSTQLMLDGEIVESSYYIDRLEHEKSYNFSAVTTLQYEQYEFLGTIDGVPTYSSEPLEIVQVFSDLVEETVNVRAGGDNFYYDYEDSEWDDEIGNQELLHYEINVKKDPSPDGNWKPYQATVHANRTYTGMATVPDEIMLDYSDIHDEEPVYDFYGYGFGVYEFMSMTWPGSSGWGRDGGISFSDELCPVTAIADSAFIGNQSLTGVEIGKNVTSIGKDAFKGCSNLTDVTSWATTPPAMTNVETFDEACYSNATLRVPESSVDKYRNADWWRKFQHIEGVKSPGLTGDVNGDGELGIADINALIDAILSSNTDPIYDINGDNEVTISDVMALIDMFLSSH